MHTLYFYHDPMCSWCWAYRPTSGRLFDALPRDIRREDVLGGLAPDTDEPMPEALRAAIAGYWRHIHDTLGTAFNFDFWDKCEPRRATYPACRAVLAAGRQGGYERMVDAIQQAYYLRAMNPSNLDTLETLAGELELDPIQFAADLRSDEIERELRRQVQFARQSPIGGFPALAADIGGEMHPLPLDYRDHEVTLRALIQLCRQR